MTPRLDELLAHMSALEEEFERELKQRRAELHADFDDRRVRFEREVLEQQRRFREGLLPYLRNAELRNVISAPFIYPLLLPLLLLDVAVTLYQCLCFPLYRIPRVRRRDYFVFDRTHLAYLNIIEKLNCAYCSYGNGLVAYVREVIARTEQYWCPIKHARRVLQAHPYYGNFADYGDGDAYRREMAALRAALTRLASEAPP